MNRLEFNNTIKNAGFNFDVGTTKDNCWNTTISYQFRDIKYYFDGTFYAVVKGKIPLKVATKIYEKYPLNQFGIRVEGGEKYQNPVDWARDEIFEEEMDKMKNKSYETFLSEYNELRRKLEGRDDSNKYIKCYHIDTVEGLQIFLNEMREYYSKENQVSTEDHKKTKQLKRE